MAGMNIISINVRGLNDEKKRRNIIAWLQDNQAKIVFLQETFCKVDYPEFNNKQWTTLHNFTNSTHSRGVAIMLNNSLTIDVLNVHKKEDARAILVNVKIGEIETTLCNIYAPTKKNERKEFLKTLKMWIARHADYPEHLILGGDMNCAINNNDRQNNAGNDDYTRPILQNLLSNHELVDAWYITNKKPHYTFIDPDNGSKSRIDYLFLSKDITYKVKKFKLKHAPKKDGHKALCMNIVLEDNRKGPGYWKLNAKLMEYPEYDIIINMIKTDINTNYRDLDHRTRWELFKIQVEEASIKLGVLKAKEKKQYLNYLQKSIDEMNELENEGIAIDNNKKNELIKKLENFYRDRDDGYMIRSKIKWVNEGERSTKYFYNLEKSRQSSNVIRQIKDEIGNIQTLDEDILSEIKKFYKKLFSSKNITQEDINEYLDSVETINTLNQTQKDSCDQQITKKEITKVIENLKNGKSPGCDGLTTEFYKKYWHEISDLFMNMVNETYEKGEMPYTLRKAILALLFKKGDKTLIKNYRPISLTNYDYKIICFVLANRLQKVLDSIIHKDQSGYIKKRYIGSNARLLEDYFEHCESAQIPGILLFLDFEKAFDSVEWNFMISVLEKFNFGKGFINWVKILYTKPIISIKNNGWLSEDIELHRGVRQGCPLSALLFVLTVEVMACAIRNNDAIHGFHCGDTEIKTSLYADDTSLLLSDLESLENAILTVEKFSKVAGPRLNKDKTEGILLGPLKDTLINYNEIKFTNEAVRCLGIYMGHDKDTCEFKNWYEKLEKMKIVFERWKNRKLTIFGKTLIIKSLAASKLIHAMSIIVTPEHILKDIERIIFNFLWDKNERIKRKTLIGPKDMGGIDMLDITSKDKSLKAGWIKRLVDKNPNSCFVNMYLQKFGIDINYLAKTTCKDANMLMDNLKLSKFWAQVFAFLNECKTIKETQLLNNSEFFSEPIWFNNRLLIANKPIFLSNWAKSNILYIKDLFRDGSLLNEVQLQENLIYRTNWMAEYLKIKRILRPFLEIFDTGVARHINIKDQWVLLYRNTLYCTKTQKSRFYYNILISKKNVRNYMEKTWERTFDMDIEWQKVYQNQVYNVQERKLGEFNYKLICNIINTRTNISKWNKNVNANCQFCNNRQTVKHLLFECPRVENLWKLIGNILQVNIRYKHLVIGNVVENDFILNRNLVLSYIAYGVYKFWILAENNKLRFDNDSLADFIKKDLFKRSLYIKNNLFLNIIDKIIRNM